jgi:hypothetical protein
MRQGVRSARNDHLIRRACHGFLRASSDADHDPTDETGLTAILLAEDGVGLEEDRDLSQR